MRMDQLAEGATLYIGEAMQSNAFVFLSGRNALIIDGLGSAEDANALLEILSDDQIRLVISTHTFSDHMALFPKLEGVPIIAHRESHRVFGMERFRSEEESSRWVEPSIAIAETLSVRWGDHHLQIFPNPGHTLGTINIDIPELDVIVVGDNLVGNICYLVYNDLPSHRDALKEIRRRGRSRLISSHGGLRNGSAVSSALHYLDSIDRFRSGETSAKDLEAFLPPDVTPTPFQRLFHDRNLIQLS